MVRIPLRDRLGKVVAYALVDDEHAAQAARRWYISKKGYVVRKGPRVHGRQPTVLLHREVLGLVPGDGLQADHINRVEKLDNRRSNLRIVTNAQNHQNQGTAKGSLSAFRGVSRSGNRPWRAEAMLAGRSYHLGYFDREEDADAACRAFRAEHMPFSAEAA